MTPIDRRASATLAFLLTALEHGVTAIPFAPPPEPRSAPDVPPVRPEGEPKGARMPGDAGAGPGPSEPER